MSPVTAQKPHWVAPAETSGQSALQACKNLDLLAVLSQLHNRLLCLGCLAKGHAPSLGLAVIVHGIDALHLGAWEHLLNRFLDHSLIGICVNQECVFSVGHCVHALLGNHRFENDIVILNVCHYAYTSSMLATAALVATTVLYFRMSYTLIVLTYAVFTVGIFLAESTTLSLSAPTTTRA